MIKLVIGMLAVWAMSVSAQAQSLQLGEPAYGGTGCPSGSAAVTVSPDNSALSILFDAFSAEAGAASGRRLDRKSCNLSVPVRVPAGYTVAVIAVDYRGFVDVPRGGMAQFDTEYFWAGSRGPRLQRRFTGPVTDNFTFTDDLLTRTLVWTPCGADVILRVNASMLAQTNNRMDQTLGQVDSVDVSSGIVYQLRWQRCR
jgi:hypothetical protein